MTAAACLGLFTTRDAAATLPLLLSTAHAWSSQITSGLGLLLEGSLRLAHAVRICAHGAYLVFAGVKVEGKLMLENHSDAANGTGIATRSQHVVHLQAVSEQ